MGISYVCSSCGKEKVKLWRPYMNYEPLICAECAEKRQAPWDYDEVIWEKTCKGYVGQLTGKRLPLPRWTIDEKGRVPSYDGPGPEEKPMPMTDKLLVDISDVSKNYSYGNTTMVPAVPCDEDSFWSYTSIPDKDIKWWEELPTR